MSPYSWTIDPADSAVFHLRCLSYSVFYHFFYWISLRFYLMIWLQLGLKDTQQQCWFSMDNITNLSIGQSPQQFDKWPRCQNNANSHYNEAFALYAQQPQMDTVKKCHIGGNGYWHDLPLMGNVWTVDPANWSLWHKLKILYKSCDKKWEFCRVCCAFNVHARVTLWAVACDTSSSQRTLLSESVSSTQSIFLTCSLKSHQHRTVYMKYFLQWVVLKLGWAHII